MPNALLYQEKHRPTFNSSAIESDMWRINGLSERFLYGNDDFSDFEDCLQMECAKSYEADYIVTRNVSDYETSEIKAITPKDYLKESFRLQ